MATEHNVNTILQACPPDPKEMTRHEEEEEEDYVGHMVWV